MEEVRCLGPAEPLQGLRVPVSVCMAAYNGEPYICAQLHSILCQLVEGDELVVVDDASVDRTRDCVRGIGDSRISLIEHSHNRGVLQSFEEAIRNAKNSIIFLSDQDDVWVPEKVTTVLREFAEDPDVTLVASDAALINAAGELISDSYFAGKREFKRGFWTNLIRNRYGGCTLAFRASLRPDILPFPRGYDVLHDAWIGIRNSLAGNKTVYIPKALVLNRRHDATATGKGRLSFIRKVRVRWHLLQALAEFSLKHKSGFPEARPTGARE